MYFSQNTAFIASNTEPMSREEKMRISNDLEIIWSMTDISIEPLIEQIGRHCAVLISEYATEKIDTCKDAEWAAARKFVETSI